MGFITEGLRQPGPVRKEEEKMSQIYVDDAENSKRTQHQSYEQRD